MSLKICNLLGQEIASVAEGDQLAGYHQETWDASGLTSGVYFYRLKAGDRVVTRKALLLN